MINPDKLLHFVLGMGIAFPLMYFSHRAWVALIVVMAFAALKETFDARHPTLHTCDGMDFIATVVGGLTGAMI